MNNIVFPKKALSGFVFFALLWALIGYQPLHAQDVRVVGQVKGISSDDRKVKPVLLANVHIEAISEAGDAVISKITNDAGLFDILLKRDKRYLLTVSREDYNKKSVWINTKDLPAQKGEKLFEITDIDFLLLKSSVFPDDISLREDMGQFSYNGKKGVYEFNVNRDFRHGADGRDFSLKVLKATINYTLEKEVAEGTEEKKETTGESTNPQKDSAPNKVIFEGEPIIGLSEWEVLTDLDLSIRKSRIDSARLLLEDLKSRAYSREDSLMIMRLEAEIKMAEVDLANAERMITAQNERLAIQGRLITFYVICLALLMVIAGVIFWFYRDKHRTNRLLEEKNRTITEGINYANRIQSSFLKSEEELREYLPGLFLLFKPRDAVSGDFYWLSEVGGKVIAAAIDCTGHGVPGAFISMIGNTLLNEIVNNKGITDPAKILESLHRGIIDALQQDSGNRHSQDGMDMALCAIDKAAAKIHFAGAKNHLFIVEKGELQVIKADVQSIGGRALRKSDGYSKSFTNKSIDIRKGQMYYLFSDGYMDQFGGPKGEKFNLPNFSNLLKKCATKSPQEQKKLMEVTFENWKGGGKQIDDVLVMGIQF
ncbi:MAG: SpoIIE family protein phosphatase [Vicingaceae bacterium]